MVKLILSLLKLVSKLDLQGLKIKTGLLENFIALAVHFILLKHSVMIALHYF